MIIKGNFTFTYHNVLYDRQDVERLIDSTNLLESTLERYRTEYTRAKQEVEELKDQVALLTHRKS